MAERRPIIERFLEKIAYEPMSGCWLWTAGLKGGGYAHFHRWTGDDYAGHRFSYEQIKGPIPEGMDLDHKCRVRSCVNPDHLEPVPRVINLRRGLGNPQKLKTHCKHGHPFTEENTYVSRKTSYRKCRTCQSNYMKTYIRKQ